MLADTLYKNTLATMSENIENSQSYNQFIIPNINLLMEELLDVENSIRIYNKQEPLAIAPTIEFLTDDVPYSDTVCRMVMPYGLAVLLCTGDDEYSKAGFFDSRYQTARQRYAKAIYVPLEDPYDTKDGD